MTILSYVFCLRFLHFFSYFCLLLDILILFFLCTCLEIALESFNPYSSISVHSSQTVYHTYIIQACSTWYFMLDTYTLGSLVFVCFSYSYLFFFSVLTGHYYYCAMNSVSLSYSFYFSDKNRQSRLSLTNQLPPGIGETSGTNLCIICFLLYNELL